MHRPRIEIVLDEAQLSAELGAAIQDCGAELNLSTLANAGGSAERSSQLAARLIITGDTSRLSNGKLRMIFDLCDHNPCATLVFSESAGPDAALEVQGRPIASAFGLSARDVAARLAGMCQAYCAMESMRREIARLREIEHQRITSAVQFTRALRQAATVQRDLLPSVLPPVAGGRFHAFYKPCEIVGGDIYDVVRLDETRIAFWLADASGHDLSAGMVAALTQAGFRHVVQTVGAAAVDPACVLAQVNDELCRLSFSECQFVTAVFGVFCEATRTVRLGRAGAPIPLLIRENRIATYLPCAGPILGLHPEPADGFRTCECELSPGDGLLAYTDGLENAWAELDGRGPLRLCLPEVIEKLGRLVEMPAGCAGDDISALALQV